MKKEDGKSQKAIIGEILRNERKQECQCLMWPLTKDKLIEISEKMELNGVIK